MPRAKVRIAKAWGTLVLIFALCFAFSLRATPKDQAAKDDCGSSYEVASTDGAIERYPKLEGVPREQEIDVDHIPRLASFSLRDLGFTEVAFVTKGGLSSILRAKRDGKTVALKVLHKESLLEDFEIEASIMNTLHAADPTHFSAARRFDVYGEDGEPLRFIEMDYIPEKPGSGIPAPTLHELFEEPEFWAEHPGAADSIRQQMRALLKRAHDEGIGHYDFKPANILVSLDEKGNPVVHLIDWGMSSQEAKEGPNQSPHVKRKTVVGTPGYIPRRRMEGGSPELSDDIYGARMVDWELRNAVENGNGDQHKVGRYLFTKFGDLIEFKEPAYALDQKGTMRERMVAAAEWSTVPKTPLDRELLIISAKTLPPEKYLEEQGKAMSAMPEPYGSKDRPRPDLTLEVLGSTLNIENLGTKTGLKLPKEDIDDIAQTAARYYVETKRYRETGDPEIVGIRHSKLHYALLGEKIDELAKAKLTKPWAEWVKEAGR